MKIDFSDVQGGFEPLPEGEYEAIIERIEVRESKSSDNDYLNWEFKITEEGEFEDRRVWGLRSLSPKALGFLKDWFLALDVIEEDDEVEVEWADDVDTTPEEGPLLTNPELHGMACIVVVSNEVYEGRERNRINEIRGVGAAPVKKAAAKKPAGGGTKTRAKKTSSGRRKALR